MNFVAARVLVVSGDMAGDLSAYSFWSMLQQQQRQLRTTPARTTKTRTAKPQQKETRRKSTKKRQTGIRTAAKVSTTRAATTSARTSATTKPERKTETTGDGGSVPNTIARSNNTFAKRERQGNSAAQGGARVPQPGRRPLLVVPAGARREVPRAGRDGRLGAGD